MFDFSQHPDKQDLGYRGYAHRVIDGDTMEVDLDLGFHLMHRVKVRLLGVNTPELDVKDEELRRRAVMAKTYLEELVKDAPLRVRTYKTLSDNYKQTFARYVADIWVWRDGLWYSVSQGIHISGYSKNTTR